MFILCLPFSLSNSLLVDTSNYFGASVEFQSSFVVYFCCAFIFLGDSFFLCAGYGHHGVWTCSMGQQSDHLELWARQQHGNKLLLYQRGNLVQWVWCALSADTHSLMMTAGMFSLGREVVLSHATGRWWASEPVGWWRLPSPRRSCDEQGSQGPGSMPDSLYTFCLVWLSLLCWWVGHLTTSVLGLDYFGVYVPMSPPQKPHTDRSGFAF